MVALTKDDNVSNLRTGSQSFQDTAEQAKDNLRDMANKAGHTAREFVHTASDEISHAKDTVTTQIRTNPVQSSLVALGVGFVLGALFRR